MTMHLRPKPQLNWKEENPRNRGRVTLRNLPIRTLTLVLALALLCACYLGPLTREATTVLAVRRELPVYSVDRDDGKIAISFDASWGGDKTTRLLEILDEYDVKATFFLVGIWVDKYPELVKAIAEHGHEVENHSTKHPHMSQLSESRIREELAGVSDKIEALTGVRPTLFRPPYGDYNNRVVTISRAEGYECVQWSVDSLDWKNRGVDDLIKRATSNVQSGDIVLFHNDSDYIVDALPTILQSYRDQGLTLVPVGELIYNPPYTIDVQGKQHPV